MSCEALDILREGLEAIWVGVLPLFAQKASQTQVLELILRLLVVATTLYIVLSSTKSSKRSKRGYGSGENDRWNRRIRTERPVHRSKHHKLEYAWVYTGSGSEVDMEAARTQPEGTVTAMDATHNAPLSGHLIGRQTWRPIGDAKQKELQDTLTWDAKGNINAGDKLLRAQLLGANGGNPADANPPAQRGAPDVTPEEAMKQGWDFFAKLQTPSGQWAGDYGGCLFLLPGLIFTLTVAGVEICPAKRQGMLAYMLNHQQEDGGWGLHIEGPSVFFGTTLNYCACRILGLPAGSPEATAARNFIRNNGGVVRAPTWAKFWLAVLGLYEWKGVNPMPSELWLLPRWFPFHPGKMWCHYRMPFLPMSYVYGVSGVGKLDPALVSALRAELFLEPYETTDWDGTRNSVADMDLYAPHTWIVDVAMWAFKRWEQYFPSFLTAPLRKAGLDFALSYIHAEDFQTNYIDIGPVNKVVNMLAVFFAEGAESDAFRRHLARVEDYLWVAEDGVKMQGYNGSQLWDTAFAMQALAASGIAQEYPDTVARVYAYIDASQAKSDVPHREKFFRTISKGGWPFSTADHGWPIADCTSEGLKAALAVHTLVQAGRADVGQGAADGFGGFRTGLITPERFHDAVNVVLAFHNPDGGWATYEETRGAPWYEYLNSAELFGDIMIDYTYTELTSACVTGLVAFRKHFPNHRTEDVNRAIDAGVQFVRDQQREDGSWYGSWAVCFTYGCWFGVEAITQGGDPAGADRDALQRCCAFLLSKQRADGGWGETYLSCLVKQYSQGPSNAVNTAWALLALIHAGCRDAHAVRRGIDYLISHQCVNGDWAQESVSGIFNRTCSITYTSYRNVFPLWALAAYCNEYAHKLDYPVAALTEKTGEPAVAEASTDSAETGSETDASTDAEEAAQARGRQMVDGAGVGLDAAPAARRRKGSRSPAVKRRA